MDYQRVWAEINLDAIGHNMQTIRKHVPIDSDIMAIVKADGYGHGAVEVSKVALYNGATSLGVAIVDEGIALRQNNIHVPILILGYTPTPKLIDVIEHNLTQTVFHYEMAKTLSEKAVKLNKTAFIHIKVDTGMSRLGFMPTQSTVSEILKIAKLPHIEVMGIYTHFAFSDNPDTQFTYEQYDKFNNLITKLEKQKLAIPMKHVSNSGAIMHCHELSLNLVRAGILLYGLAPSFETDISALHLQPAMSLKTHTSYVKSVTANTSVGYSRTFYTKKKSLIATVPVGYADGYLRALGNHGRVLIGGQYAPIVGNICMDQFMVDVTHIETVSSNDEVVLIGRQGSNEVSADELAKIQGTINYEIICNVGKRVPRAYFKNNDLLKVISIINS